MIVVVDDIEAIEQAIVNGNSDELVQHTIKAYHQLIVYYYNCNYSAQRNTSKISLIIIICNVFYTSELLSQRFLVVIFVLMML